MKNTFKQLGIVTVIAAIVLFSMVYCKDTTQQDVTFTVRFDPNGGNGTAPAAQTVSSGSSITIPKEGGLTRTGLTFGGWNTNASGTGTNYTAGSSYTVTGNITLYARWIGIEEIVSVTGVELVRVPGGSFQMGKNGDGSSGDYTPVHTVTLTGFYMGKYEVTQAQYQVVMGTNPSDFSGNNLPVESVSWYDALVFCNKLSMAEGLIPAYRISDSTDPSAWGTVPTSSNSTWNAVEIVSGSNGYRLPTEAQWEYAAKGGDGSPGNYTYAGSDDPDEVAWYRNNSSNGTKPVGTKVPNGLGLYDMSGNVWEWCWDWYGGYSSEAQNDPEGVSSGSDRVIRGGGWDTLAEDIRSAYRRDLDPSSRFSLLGFRLTRP